MRARKRFGQHFLEPSWTARVVDAVEPSPDDDVIEIGPGRGAITIPLARRVRWLHAVEVDRDLAAALRARQLPNVTVVTGDVLALSITDLARRALAHAPAGPQIRVVGNLPYNISTPILLALLDAAAGGLLRDATLMLQREVADRLVAPAGTREYGVLTISTALRADVRRLLALPPGAFRPVPRVHSAVVRLTFRPPPPGVSDPVLLIALVRAIFTGRRKMLSNALAGFATARGVEARGALIDAGIVPTRRPETLTLEELARLAARFEGPVGAPGR